MRYSEFKERYVAIRNEIARLAKAYGRERDDLFDEQYALLNALNELLKRRYALSGELTLEVTFEPEVTFDTPDRIWYTLWRGSVERPMQISEMSIAEMQSALWVKILVERYVAGERDELISEEDWRKL